jgi:glycerol-3-phosphate dehydrogenase (NAD(P)+)
MARVTILGAGDMGTALVTPLVQNGHDVRLWGTERDTDIVAALRSGDVHPRLQTALPAGAIVFAHDEAGEALTEAEIAVVAITSDAVRTVLSRLAPLPASVNAIVTVAKGFDSGPGRDVQLLPATIAEFTTASVVAVGGPSKANEVARAQPTAVVFGSDDRAALDRCLTLFATPAYKIEGTNDVIGLELAAAMKNAYAIALGICDGLEKRSGVPYHNLRAALFPRAVTEMAALAEVRGGRAETVRGLAGAGDLQVTVTSGRNRLLGEMLGLGESPARAVQTLSAGNTTIEGFLATAFGHRLYRQCVTEGSLPEGSLPLLDATWRILYQDALPLATLWRAS